MHFYTQQISIQLPPHLVRLGAMTRLSRSFPNTVFGLSDHTTSNYTCFGAVALGASILERHYTDDLTREGPDISNSMDSKQAKELIEGSRIIKEARGGSKGPVKEEKSVIDFAFSSVVSIMDIKKGDKFTEKNIWVKRPGTGPYFAKDYNQILGKLANRDISSDSHIEIGDFD